MTRHGMLQPSAADTQPPATNPHASVEFIQADRPRPAPHRADNVTRKRKRAVCPHPSWSFPAAVTPIRTSAEIRNPHSQPSGPRVPA